MSAKGASANRIIQTPGLGAEQDWAKARELVRLLRCIEHPDTDVKAVKPELDSLDTALWQEAVNLVRKHATAIKTVAQVLVERISAPGETLKVSPSDLEGLPEVQGII